MSAASLDVAATGNRAAAQRYQRVFTEDAARQFSSADRRQRAASSVSAACRRRR